MKFSTTTLVSCLLYIGTAASKKHGLRRALKFHDELTAIGETQAECMEYFTDMDIDGDDVLSL